MPSKTHDGSTLESFAVAEFGALSPAEQILVRGATASIPVCYGFRPPLDLPKLLTDPSLLPEFAEGGIPPDT